MRLCRAVLDNQAVYALLLDEPGGHCLYLTPDPEQQHTMLLRLYEMPYHRFSPTDPADARLLLSVRVKRKQLLGMLMAELWKLHAALREPSYQKGRDAGVAEEALFGLNAEWDAHPRLGPSFLK